MIRTIFLDAAGTLIEPAEPVAAVYVRHFAAAGWTVEEIRVKNAFRETFGALPAPDYQTYPDGDAAEQRWWRELVGAVAARCGLDPTGPVFEGCFRDLFAHYSQGSAWRVFPEVGGFLTVLKGRGSRLAVVSNFDRRLHRILAGLGLAPFFDAIVTSADARSRKPDSGIFRHTLDLLGAEPAEVAHIGDHAKADGEGAAAVGIPVFVLDRPTITLEDALCWLDLKK